MSAAAEVARFARASRKAPYREGEWGVLSAGQAGRPLRIDPADLRDYLTREVGT